MLKAHKGNLGICFCCLAKGKIFFFYYKIELFSFLKRKVFIVEFYVLWCCENYRDLGRIIEDFYELCGALKSQKNSRIHKQLHKSSWRLQKLSWNFKVPQALPHGLTLNISLPSDLSRFNEHIFLFELTYLLTFLSILLLIT